MEEGRKAYLRKEFEKFYKENYSRFYYYALTLVPDDEVCKDLVDDSFHYLWERIESFQWNTGVTYMYTHVHHLCIDYLRRAKMEEKHRDHGPNQCHRQRRHDLKCDISRMKHSIKHEKNHSERKNRKKEKPSR